MSNTTASEIRVVLFPRDFALSRQFYLETMKWPVQYEWDREDGKGVLFDIGCGIVELLSPLNLEAPTGTCSVSLRVIDVWSLWEEIFDRAPIVFPLRENSWGDDSFCISDPDGNKLTFFTDRQ